MAARSRLFRTTSKILIALGATTLAPMVLAAWLAGPASTASQVQAEEAPGSSVELDEATSDALRAALDDERRSQATYRAVIDRHGEVLPFARIVEAEGRHEAHLLTLFESYGLAIPKNPWKDRQIEVPATVVEACRQGVESERVNVALYDELLAAGTIAQTEIRELFGHLRDMSRDHHLQAFTRCVDRGGAGPGMGRGKGAGQGPGKGPGMVRQRGERKAQGGCPGMGRGKLRGMSGGLVSGTGRSTDPESESGAFCGRGRCGDGEACGQCGRGPQAPAEEASKQ